MCEPQYINLIDGDINKSSCITFNNKELWLKLLNGEIEPECIRFKVKVEAWDLDENGNPQRVIDENGNTTRVIKTKKVDQCVCNLQLEFAPRTEE